MGDVITNQITHMKSKKQTIALKFFNAVDAINKSTNYKDPTIQKTLNDNLDKVIIEYRKVHNLRSELGFFDLMNHYNQNYAK